jgi:hypothetical protein
MYRTLVGKSEGKRKLGRPKGRWEDNIEMDLQEVGFEGMDWTGLAQDRDSFTATVPQPTDIVRTQCTKFRLCSASWGCASNSRNMIFNILK